ncbi:lycopene cyclase domain-containing protein [Mucilaginibacter pallidiroseus]|uniref:Lycopene cyclase domain-containing protein n=1 Tax=Mucilaginibacter pallidiroseus TaxID=2599295 RepID=A0A563UD73_9SPHI|nr:lycopene cyclase domain-containing protein [Mucilaginibacter pallidiroseus]TWR29270.1 lycopene cyclase domain-containing protein [Mucilaginibacter pallidiroseus]
MKSNYTYLLINIATIFFPLVLSFDKRVTFFRKWKFIWPGMALTGLLFLFWDVLFTIYGVWSFNDKYIIGIRFYGLPLEEILFFLTVPFACIFIHECLNYYVKWQPGATLTRYVSIGLITLSGILLVIYSNRLYTAVTFGLLLIILLLLTFTLRAKWMGRFYMAFLVTLIPFYVVNGMLTSIPVVLYNNAQNMATRVGTIPFEDHFYSMALLVMNIGFFEYSKKRNS